MLLFSHRTVTNGERDALCMAADGGDEVKLSSVETGGRNSRAATCAIMHCSERVPADGLGYGGVAGGSVDQLDLTR
jgi:hypothetical protein